MRVRIATCAKVYIRSPSMDCYGRANELMPRTQERCNCNVLILPEHYVEVAVVLSTTF